MHENLPTHPVRALILGPADRHTDSVCEDLRLAGIQVARAHTTSEALDSARREPVAVVAADLRLPNLNLAMFRQALDAVDPQTRLVTFPVKKRSAGASASGTPPGPHDATLLLRIVRGVVEYHTAIRTERDVLRHLARRVAHEYDNILTAILGNLELLCEYLRSDPPDVTAAMYCVEQMEMSSRQGAALTRNLIEFLEAGGIRRLVGVTGGRSWPAERSTRSIPV